MQLSFDFGDFLMLALALQGFILSGLLFYSSKKIISNRWLGALIFIVSESTLMMELDYSGVWGKYPILQLVIMHFILAIGPVIYFYTQSLVFNRDKLTKREWLNFLPLLLEMKFQAIYFFYITGLLSVSFIENLYFLPSTQQLLFGNFPFTTIAALISVTVYSIITYRGILRYEKKEQISVYKLKDLQWIKKLLYFIFAFIIIWLFSLVSDLPPLWNHYLLYIPAIAFVYVLGMAAWHRQNKMPEVEMAEYIQRAAKPCFTKLEAASYSKKLSELMYVKRIYLNPVLKVEDVAANMSISEKALSSLLNQHIGKSFNDFVNEYRIEEVKIKLADPANHHFTIAAIAFDCGFNSLATFQRVFKQFTGITPSKFQSDNLLPRVAVK
jgi:AraC-like DNA-binding protein